MSKLPTKIFSSYEGKFIEQPDLALIQTKSYEWFRTEGLKELFKEFSPITDYSGKRFEIYFLDYYFDEPKYTEEEARYKGITYEASLRVRVRLINLETKEKKEQEVYLGDFPQMTTRGTFIVNGVERVVISQLVRSPGVYFTLNLYRGRKLFGAKLIPHRGAWLEFETDPDGSIGVKIDRYRKVPVSSLLRIFSQDDEAILKTFGELIRPTLEKDSAKNTTDSYLEIYSRIRPGDLATAEDAQKLVDSMFKQSERYDLSLVGRFKLNQRLETKGGENNLVALEDITKIVQEIFRLNEDPAALPDDVDHLGNRRVRALGELLQIRLRVGFTRVRRTVQDRMSTTEPEETTPIQLINPRPLVAAVREFFASSQMSQFLGQVNPLDELEHKRRLTALGVGGLTRERAGMEVRDVHSSYYGRICPIQTPEGANIGLVNHLSSYAQLNEHGFLVTPYMEVKSGRLTGNIVWLDAKEEEKYKIASVAVKTHGQKLVDEEVDARWRGEPGTYPAHEIEFTDVAPSQLVSVATSLVPFLEHTDASRALMASNMQRQAVPCVRPAAPYVATGVEDRAARDSGRMVVSHSAGTVDSVDADHIVVKAADGKKHRYDLDKFKMSNQYIAISHRPLVAKGDKVKKGDVLADGQSTDNGTLALGQNLVVAFASWEGANFEDAIIFSEKVQRDAIYSSIHINEFTVDVRDTKLGPELTTPDIPNVAEDKLRNLDEEGIIRIGAEVRGGDILVGKISPKGESELTPEERLLRAIFGEKARDVKDSSLELPHGKFGRVVGVKIFSRDKGDKLDPGVISRIYVQVATLRNIQAGDKIAGRHGNKGVISQIRPMEDMPYLEDGTPVDVILNPLGVVSRMNLGQIFETHLGWAAQRLGYRAVTPVFSGASEEAIREELKKAGLPEGGKVALYDGRTGEPFKEKVAVGVIYLMKLNHLVADKIHMRSIGPYSLITQQPLGGKAQLGGQRFGEMEVWALEGYGAAHTLQEMLTVKSDDVIGRSAIYEAIVRGERLRREHLPASFNVMVNELKALGLSVEAIRDEEGQPRRGRRNQDE